MDALGTLGVALAGGSAGAILTLAAGVPEQVRHHNRQAREYDEDLAQWVSDEMVRLERACRGASTVYASQGQRETGAYLRAVAALKEEALHRYRDQEAMMARKWEALKDTEGFRHRAWRRVMRQGELPELTTPRRAAPLLDLWRHEVEKDGATAPVSDPTRRPLQWALDKYDTDDHRSHGWPTP